MLSLTAQQFNNHRLFNLKGMKATRQMDGYAGPIRSLAEADNDEDIIDVNCDWMVQLSGDIGNAIIYANEHLGEHPKDLDDEAFTYIKTTTTAIIRNCRDSKTLKPYERWDFAMAELFVSLLKRKSKDYQSSLNFVYNYFRFINVDREYTGFLKNVVRILRNEVGSSPIRQFIANMNDSFAKIGSIRSEFAKYFKDDRWQYKATHVFTKGNTEIFSYVLNRHSSIDGDYIRDCIESALLMFMDTMKNFKQFTIPDIRIMGNSSDDHTEAIITILMDHWLNKYRRNRGSERAIDGIDSLILVMTRPDGLEVPHKEIVLEFLDSRREEIQEYLKSEKKKK